jgi:hypothetical protein
MSRLVGSVTSHKLASSTTFDAREGRPATDLHDVAQRVHQEFDDRLDPRTVDKCLATVPAKFTDAKVRASVPLLVRRYVSDELHERIEHG